MRREWFREKVSSGFIYWWYKKLNSQEVLVLFPALVGKRDRASCADQEVRTFMGDNSPQSFG